MAEDGSEFYRRREAQERGASDRASDPMIKRLHQEMAQRYAYLADQAESMSEATRETSSLPAETVSF